MRQELSATAEGRVHSPSSGSPRARALLRFAAPVDLQLRMVQAAVQAQLFGRADRPVQVGRYTVLGPIGSGGMGSVVRAHDPQLQREVALKLLRAERMGDATTRARLVQEARAMARLAHPNVAMVFEVDEADGHLYVAMELVDGRDLRAWLESRSRPWRATLELFVQAGRGLAAAHAKGLIHRDFKPDNVVVDAQGRARVVDFGLAREQGSAEVQTEDDRDPSEAMPESGATELTTTGTLLGTPAYMSPEQWRGEVVDARSDQFSFCVSLWEALYGARPFTQTELGSLMLAVTQGHVEPPPSSAVPGRVLRALRRGLQPDPDDRFADMDALLVALAPPRRTGWLVAAGALVVVGAATAGVLAGERDPSEGCRDEAERLAGVWDDARRGAAGQGLSTTALPYAETVWASIAPRIDGYAAAWTTQAEASCVGALAQTDAARTRNARQQRCLDDALAALSELSGQLARADEAVAVDAAYAVTRLPDLSACADDRRLARWADEPTPSQADAMQRARAALAQARRSLAVLDTREGGTRYVAELEQGRQAAQRAREVAMAAEHAPLRAEASLALGRLQLKLGDKATAERSLAEAVEQAELGGDALTRARASIMQVYVVGNDRDRTAEALSLGEQVLAQLDGLGPRPLLQARLRSNLATAVARAREPDHARALALHREAIELLRGQLGDEHPHMIAARLNLGRALIYAGDPTAAQQQLHTALALAQRVWGEDHPHTARVWGTLGTALAAGGSQPEARRALERSLQARERSLGAEHPEVASALFNLASALRRDGQHAQAVDHLRRGLAIRRATDGDGPELIPWLYMIGDSEVERGEPAAAQPVLREALALAETDGASPLDFAKVRFGLARALEVDDPVQARLVAEAARDAYRAHGRAEQADRVDAFVQRLR
ncbi:MAG: serine/threonine-protein kinase [Nannocystaceae bacterium]